MDWKNAASSFASAGLRTLGTVLAGPAGGSAAGLLCGWLGLDASDPEAPAQAVDLLSNPVAVLQLRAKEQEHEAELTRLHLAAETAAIVAANRTMRAEAVSEHWPQYSWRPFWGFASAIAFVFVVILCCLLAQDAIYGSNPGAMAMLPQMITSFTSLFAIPGAILGVAAWHRGLEKRELANKGGCQ